MPNFNVNMTPAEYKAGQKKAQAKAIRNFFIVLVLVSASCATFYYLPYSAVHIP